MEGKDSPTVKRKKNVISVSLIASRNLVNKKELSADQVANELLKLTHIRLDRENIECIEDLDCLGPVTYLYLQCNKIKTIENLDVVPNLRFLTLAENQITKIENLRCLKSLMFLDLSYNKIDSFDPDELPKSLVIVNLSGNPCVNTSDYRSKIIKSLDRLEQLDEKTVTKQEKRDCGCPVEASDSDSEDEDEELSEEKQKDITLTSSAEGELNQYCNDILVRAKIRTMKEDADHEKRLDELADLRTDVINTARRARKNDCKKKDLAFKRADGRNSTEPSY